MLDIFESDDVIAKNREKSNLMNEKMKVLAAHHKVEHFRNTGMIWAFEVADPSPDFSRRFYLAALGKGLLLRPMGNTVYFMPPYVIEEDEMDFLVQGTLELL